MNLKLLIQTVYNFLTAETFAFFVEKGAREVRETRS